MSANTRIQWLHKKMTMKSYPNAQRIAERFNISHRQAQRDLDYLRRELGAPIEYDAKRKGFYYTQPFVLPLLLSSDNDEHYIPEIFNVVDKQELAADESIIQMQIPYTATVEIPDKLSVLSFKGFIISKESRNKYVCEFHNIEQFLGAFMTLKSDVKIIQPTWLRERLVKMAENIIKNNKES